MIIPCPKCQARLNLPEDTAGIEVRCPGCRHVFRAAPEAEPRMVERGPPKRSLDPKPRASSYPDDDDDLYEPRPRRRYGDDYDLLEPSGDKKVLEDNAREHTRFAGQAMLTAGFGTLGGLIVNRGLAVFQDFEQGQGFNNPEFVATFVFGLVIRLIFFGPLLLIVLSAGRNLLCLGSRGMIQGGVIASFVMAAALALGVLGDLIGMARLFGGSSPLVIPQMLLTALSSGVSLTAGVLTARALSEQHVRQHYELQREQSRRYRY